MHASSGTCRGLSQRAHGTFNNCSTLSIAGGQGGSIWWARRLGRSHRNTGFIGDWAADGRERVFMLRLNAHRL